MKAKFGRIMLSAFCSIVLLGGCGQVGVIETGMTNENNISDSAEKSTGSKKRSGSGNDEEADIQDGVYKNENEAATYASLPVFDPPENGKVVENTNKKKKDDDSDETETTASENESSEQNGGNSKPSDNKKKNTPSEILKSMTLEEKVCQMFIAEPEQLAGYIDYYSGDDMKGAMDIYPVGGFMYFSRHLSDVGQTTEMLGNVQKYSKDRIGTGVFTAIDEEGGTVARCADALGTTWFENMAYYGMENDGTVAYDIGSTLGNDLGSLGFNLDFAPVADVNINPYNELGSRIFSDDPNVVANMVGNVIRGLQDAGVCATAKHFPGLGAEGGNTHEDSYVIIERTMEELRETEFIPFKQAINDGVDFIMVGHQITTGAGDNLPGDLSYEVCTGMLRNELGFNGIIVSDSHKMNTIANVYSSGDAAVMSINAGVDMILTPYSLADAVSGVCEAVNSGVISESRIDESVKRILDLKYSMGLMK